MTNILRNPKKSKNLEGMKHAKTNNKNLKTKKEPHITRPVFYAEGRKFIQVYEEDIGVLWDPDGEPPRVHAFIRNVQLHFKTWHDDARLANMKVLACVHT